MNNKYWIWFAFSCIFFVMLVMNFLTPLSLSDDYAYMYIVYHPNHWPPEHVNNLKDVLISQYNRWLGSTNGRVVPHFFVQTFVGILGKPFFNFANAFQTCCLLYLLCGFSSRKHDLWMLLTSFLLYIFFISAFNETTLWLTGSCNYLWSAVFVLAFLMFLKSIWSKTINTKLLFLSPLSLLIGWNHEAFTVPVCIVFLLFCLIHIRVIWTKAIMPYILFFALGTCFNVFAPSTLNKLSSNSDLGVVNTLLQHFPSFLVALSRMSLLWIFVFSLFLTWLYEKKIFKSFIRNNWFDCAILLSSLFVVFIAADSKPRVRYAVEVFSLLSFLSLLSYSIPHIVKEKQSYISLLCFLVLTIIVPVIMFFQLENYRVFKNCEAQLKQPHISLILSPTDILPARFNKYVMKHVEFGQQAWYLPINDSFTELPLVAYSYGKDSLVYLPQNVYDDIRNRNNDYSQFKNIANSELYIRKMKPGEQLSTAYYKLRPSNHDEIPTLVKPFANYIHRYSCLSEIPRNFGVMYIDGERYAVLVKPIEEISRRIVDIVIE